MSVLADKLSLFRIMGRKRDITISVNRASFGTFTVQLLDFIEQLQLEICAVVRCAYIDLTAELDALVCPHKHGFFNVYVQTKKHQSSAARVDKTENWCIRFNRSL